MATTPLDHFTIQGRLRAVYRVPLELALEICETLKSPADMISYALSTPALLDYWIHIREIIEQRRPTEEDPESNPHIYVTPPITNGPILYDPEGAVTFQAYSRRIMSKLYSPEIQRLVLLILFMPNPSNRIYNIEFRRQHPQICNPSPYPLLFQRREERFQRYYIDEEYRDLLFTFKNLNRISPYWTTVHDFATDFAKKALSMAPNWAHHSAPAFAEGGLNWYSLDPNGPRAREFRDSSPIQSLDQLHATERERLLLAFYQYEAVCATSTKISGYWEIRRAIDAGINNQHNFEAWNDERVRQSPLAQQSSCQIERVVTVYYYVRLQYLFLFHSLWLDYTDSLALSQTSSLGIEASDELPLGIAMEMPAVFHDKQSLLEWIDILCSRGLLFLHEVLMMDTDQRRIFFVTTYYPTRAKNTNGLTDRDYIMKGFFDTLSLRPALDDAVNYSDELDNASGPNLAWLRYNTVASQGTTRIKTANFVNEAELNLRRTGYVFWNADRCIALGLDDRGKLEEIQFNADNSWGQATYGVAGWLDSPFQLDHSIGELGFMNAERFFHDLALLEARRPYMTPKPAPLLVEFGILGETWRVGENLATLGGEPLLPNFNFDLPTA
ncbi:hypothetical protein F5B21DRAFT_523618 [Xylaria acuta]|nr:hypothetical protein F5B21DRAFT_523618 [Xylaria acuta]